MSVYPLPRRPRLSSGPGTVRTVVGRVNRDFAGKRPGRRCRKHEAEKQVTEVSVDVPDSHRRDIVSAPAARLDLPRQAKLISIAYSTSILVIFL